MSLAARPEALIEMPDLGGAGRHGGDVLSAVLSRVRLSGSLQFCFMPTGDWETDSEPSLSKLGSGSSGTIPFHILVEGTCWLRMEGQETVLAEGDIVAFPAGTGHQLGAGSGGRRVTPVADLPPKPWRELPILRYGGEGPRVRLLCGFLQCDALSFRPIREALPRLLHVSTRSGRAAWLGATIRQIAAESDRPRAGGLSMLERLTEISFIELLRNEIGSSGSRPTGWLAALDHPPLERCLALIHGDPARDWTLAELAAASGLSRSALMQRFLTVLAVPPMRYLREWRLCLAGIALRTTDKPIAVIAHEAGYGTEAAFTRAFTRSLLMPPAAWRRSAVPTDRGS